MAMLMMEHTAMLTMIQLSYQGYSPAELLEDWIKSNKLVVNPDKTHLMVMETRKSELKGVRLVFKQDLLPFFQLKLRNFLGGSFTSL